MTVHLPLFFILAFAVDTAALTLSDPTVDACKQEIKRLKRVRLLIQIKKLRPVIKLEHLSSDANRT